MKIRNANKKDVDAVFKIGKKIKELEFSKKYPFHDKSELNESIKNKKDIFLVAEENNEIKGFLLGVILFKNAGGWFMLDNLAVKKENRRKGIAKLLLEKTYEKLKKEKINYIQLLEEVDYKETRAFWKKNGYNETKKFVWAEKELK